MLRKSLLTFVLLTLLYTPTFASEIAGIAVPDTYPLNETELVLNGSGIRKKFFVKVYVGSLYTTSKITTSETLFAPNFTGVIKMSILYKEIEAKKLQAAYIEGFEANTPEDVNDIALKEFVSAFNFDVKKGDTIDIIFSNSQTVMIKLNNTEIKSFQSNKLVNAVLKVYFGKKPADKNLKKGMLNL